MTKRNRGRLLAALLSVGTLALIGPAMASAEVWKDGGKTVTTPFSLGLSGAMTYEIHILDPKLQGGVNCLEQMTLSSTGGSNATISAFQSKGCGAPFGSLSGCQVASHVALGLPGASPWGRRERSSRSRGRT